MKSEEYIHKVRHLEWLKSIQKDYQDHAETMKKHPTDITIQSVGYTERGGVSRLNVNPHRPIPARYIYGGLVDALDSLAKEIEELEKELKTVIVSL